MKFLISFVSLLMTLASAQATSQVVAKENLVCSFSTFFEDESKNETKEIVTPIDDNLDSQVVAPIEVSGFHAKMNITYIPTTGVTNIVLMAKDPSGKSKIIFDLNGITPYKVERHYGFGQTTYGAAAKALVGNADLKSVFVGCERK